MAYREWNVEMFHLEDVIGFSYVASCTGRVKVYNIFAPLNFCFCVLVIILIIHLFDF